jgi:pimeloyl-ACP methyl ester carboxylesterase
MKKELEKELPDWVVKNSEEIEMPFFKFEEIFPKMLEIMSREKQNGNEVIINVHGASLLMAALREPALFSALIVFEPIVFPPPPANAPPRPENPLAGGARKRRSRFGSFDDALENFASKPPMSTFHPSAREAYVRHGFAPTIDGDIELKCLPEHEARTYETGGTSGAWDDLSSITTPVWVVSGAPAPFQPSSFALSVAEQIPHATYIQFDELGHFGPLERPDMLATLTQNVATQL